MSGLPNTVAHLVIRYLENVEELKTEHEKQIKQICEKHDLDECPCCETLMGSDRAECEICQTITCRACMQCTEDICVDCTSDWYYDEMCYICGGNPAFGLRKLECGCSVCIYRNGMTQLDLDPKYQSKCPHME